MAIPIIFRALFFIFDFALPLFGVWANTNAPALVLGGHAKSPVLPPTPETVVLLDGLAGWFAALAFLTFWLNFYRSQDVSCWRAVQFALVLVDAFQLLGFYRGLTLEGRVKDYDNYRPEDWNNIIGYSVIMLVRLVFVLTAKDRSLKAKSA